MMYFAFVIPAEDEGPGHVLEIKEVLGYWIDIIGAEFHDLESTSFQPDLQEQVIAEIVFPLVFI